MLTLEGTAANGSLEEPIAVPLARLLVSSSRGDERAFAELYDRTSSRVYGLVMHVVRDAAQADEVTQEVYLQAWQRAATYRRELAPVLTWLLTMPTAAPWTGCGTARPPVPGMTVTRCNEQRSSMTTWVSKRRGISTFFACAKGYGSSVIASAKP